MATTYIGTTTALTRVQRSTRWTSDRGDQIVEEYKGPLAVALVDYAAAKTSGAWDEVQLERDRGVGTLRLVVTADVSEGPPDDPIPVWELTGQDLFRDIRAFGGGTAKGIAFNAAANQEAFEDVRRKVESASIAGLFPLSDPMKTYAELLLRGTNEYVRSTCILRSTLYLNARSVAKASWTGVDRAWKVGGEAGSPSPPGTGSSGILGVIADMPDAASGKRQWLKRAPQVRSQDRGHFQVTQEWWFSRRWSYVLYDGDNEADNP